MSGWSHTPERGTPAVSAAETSEAPPRRRTRRQRVLLGVGVAVSVVLLAGAAVVGWGAWKLHQIDRAEVDLDELVADGPANYLVVGSDSRAEGDPLDPSAASDHQPLADTIMIVRVDPGTKVARVLSLPRDLWVTVAGTGKEGRINAAYSAGPQRLIDTLRDELDIPINHYVEVDFAGFEQMVNAVDGVPMWFDRALRDRNTGLVVGGTGCTTLDGRNALAFARSRHLQYFEDGAWHADGTGDLGRISRQQLFMRRLIDRAKGKGISNPLTLKKLVDVGVSNVTIDDDLSVGEIVALGRRFSSFDSNALETFTLPTTPRTTSGGAAVVELDPTAAAPILGLFRQVGPDAPPDSAVPTSTTVPSVPLLDPGEVTVTVLNASTTQGVAFTAYRDLERQGFTVDHYGNGDEQGHAHEKRSIVRYGPGGDYAAATVAAYLSSGAETEEDPSLPGGTVVLYLGDDHGDIARPAPTTTTAPPTTTTIVGTPVSAVPGEQVGVVPLDPPPGKTCG